MPAFLASELPELCRTRHHVIVLLRPPHKLSFAAWALLLVIALVDRSIGWWLILAAVTALAAVFRWLTWRAELVILTRKRIIRVQGIPETTTSEASLRLDRVSGARLIETVPGRLLGYGTIDLEAPGEHPDVRHLVRIKKANEFYLVLRAVIFGDDVPLDPDDQPPGYFNEVTEPLPQPPPRRPDRPFGRHRPS